MTHAAFSTSDPVSSQWEALDAALLRRGALQLGRDRRKNMLRLRLYRFMRWCAEAHVVPEFVDAETVRRYLTSRRPPKGPSSAMRRNTDLERAWNQAACVIPGWPANLLPPPQRGPRTNLMHDSIVSFAETDFHPALVAEAALYCERGGFLDLGHEATGAMTHRERMAARIDKLNVALASGEKVPDYGRHPARLGRGALYDHKRVIYRAATALHLAGVADIDNLRSIRDVITPGAAAVLVDALQARSLRPTYALRSLQVFSQLSKRCGLLFSPAESMAFRELRSDLYANGGRGRELSDKNLKRLWQFDDPDTFAMLVALPQVMMQELEERRRRRKGRATLKDARQARAAVGMEILSTLPIRRGTLLSLDLRRNFLPRRDAPPLLVIYPDQVKTARALDTAMKSG